MTKDRKIVLAKGGTRRTWSELQKDKTLHDEENPGILLSVTELLLVRMIAAGRNDIVALAKCDLKSKGFRFPL